MNKKPVMTPKEFAENMEFIKDNESHDPEAAHGSVDCLMEEVLISLGYKKGIEISNGIKKY
jgi:hypothetical protein